ncbi:MAG: response regulator, partial [Opitutaceae bacterium]
MVRDTGVGITPADQARLFRPFTQALESRIRPEGGTGLGLAICKQLVGRMGGDIGVVSALGEGSTFWFTVELPVVEGAAGALAAPPALRGMSVLLADDNAASRELLERQLKEWSMEVSAVASGGEAFRLARERAAAGLAFDLAVIDLRMPGMSGTALTSALRADPALAATGTLLLTTVADLMSRAELAQAGADFAVTKPVSVARLREALLAASGHAQPVAPEAAAREEARSELGITVLVAEDNLVSQSVLQLQLRKLGCRSRVVENGRLAVEAVQ